MADIEENVEDMVGTPRETAGGDRVRRERDRDETSGPGEETGNKTAATVVTNETAATGGVMNTDEGELEFDEDDMA